MAPVAAADPKSAVLDDPRVPESRRFCGACEHPVGRSRLGHDGRLAGFCPKCGRAYSFVPALKPDDLLAGQYLVAGCLAHGGLGWIYLAVDRKVSDRWVVLKGLLNTGDEAAMAAAIAEREFLARVEHPNIVRIHNFVEHDGAGYIVMEYLGGASLKDLRRGADDQPGPMRAAVGVAYMLEALPALGHLHSRGLLYCDFKPDNVIQTEEQLKIIDLGGVRRIDDQTSDLYGTIGYQAPEVAEHGASVASDLYTVGRSLAVLLIDFPGFQDERRYAYSLPPVEQTPLFGRYPALYLFLSKATRPDPAGRFLSAGEMAGQLRGVLAQVVGADGGSPPSITSRNFSPDLGSDPEAPSWSSLPVPLIDPDDPAAGVLTGLGSATSEQLLAALEAVAPGTEVQLQKVRALIETGQSREAASLLETVVLTGQAWRWEWWRAMIDLAEGRHPAALQRFASVSAELPGELAPILAMGVTAELQGDDHAAGEAYRIAASTDATYSTAVFGLARVLRRKGDRQGAVGALRRIPTASSAYQPARQAIVTTMADTITGPPAAADLVAASEALVGMTVDVARRTELTRDLLLAALDVILSDGPSPDVRIAGVPLDEVPVRQALERTCRSLAKLTQDHADRIRLIDQANTFRPRSLL